MAKMIRDLTDDFRMPADSHAGLYEIGGTYYVAWGLGDEATAEGDRWDAPNTAEHGVETFADLDAAERHIADVIECHESIGA